MSDPIVQKLDEMQARCNAATEGPWEAEGSQVRSIDSLVAAVRDHSVSERRPDAEFIAASHTDMPHLIAALKAVLELTNEAEEERRAAGPAWDMRQDGAATLADHIEQAIEEALGVDDE